MSKELLNSCEMNTAAASRFTQGALRENFLPSMAIATLRGAAGLAVLSMLLVATPEIARAQTLSVLYTFCSQPNCTDGRTPAPNLLLDGGGNLYGVAGGGNSQFYGGVVFQVSPKAGETLLYNFSAINQGLGPNGGLIRDASGNFYGTTAGGGDDQGKCKKYAGCGLVYKLTNGTEQVLYDFLGAADGESPNGGLVFDQQGNLYGTTYRGGAENDSAKAGTIFEVSASGTETVLHRFGLVDGDGKFPNAGLVMDQKGNFYGTTIEGGADGNYGSGIPCLNRCGTVFKLTPSGVETVLYAFQGWGPGDGDGAVPFSSLILDAKGDLYGTTYAGGAYGQGTVFKITPTGTETVLYSFGGAPDGAFPVGRLVLDAQGNLYGTTSYGGKHNQGMAFELTTSNAEKKLYSFTGGADGGSPLGGLEMDSQRNLYGTTFLGGNFNSSCPAGCGVVFKVTP